MKNFKIPMYSEEVKEFNLKVIKKYNPKCIILYGSLARGDYNERSDIDLVIISDSFVINPLERLKNLMDLNRSGAPIEPLGYTSKEFELMLNKRNPTALFALEDGIPLFGKKYFLKLKRRYKLIKKKFGLILDECVWVPTKLIKN